MNRTIVFPLAVLALLLATAALPRALTAQRADSQNPHGVLPRGLDCTNCHLPNAWTPVKEDIVFDHNRGTRFPLDGRHASATCGSCHLNNRFDQPQATPADCTSCHVDVHQGNLSSNCLSCHNTLSFTEVRGLDVHAATQFPLLGAHMQVTCESCHLDDRRGAFTTLDTHCLSCHQPDYQDAQSIDHVDADFPETCEQCHNTLAWAGGTVFDHITVSRGFPLFGAHEQTSCRGCHIMPGAALINTPANENDCVSCHLADYQEEHGGSRFPTTCLQCHTQDTWDDATFDHNTATAFPLVGAHIRTNCDNCHTQPGNRLIFPPGNPEDCIACHLADYQKEHATTGFPTTCLSCHTQEEWGNATFQDHDAQFFPIFSGKHRNKWNNDCTTCHAVAGNFASFTCLNCHEHNKTKMDDKHKDEAGYVYESTACLSCHPDGREK